MVSLVVKRHACGSEGSIENISKAYEEASTRGGQNVGMPAGLIGW